MIQHALALGRARNFARAADALNLTQPSLSRSIALLERELGVPLFDRGRTGVSPTAYGRLLLEAGATLVGGEVELRRQLQLLGGLEAGRLVIGAGPYASETSVATAVVRLMNAHPRLRIEVVTTGPEEILDRVLAGAFDVGVADLGSCTERRLSVQAFRRHEVLLACRPGHPLAGKRNPGLAEILAFPLVSSILRGDAAATVLAGGGLGSSNADTGDFAPTIQVNSIAMARRIARDTDALVPGTIAMLTPDLKAGRLVVIDFHVAAMRTQYSLLYLRDRMLAPAAVAFVEILRAVEAELDAESRVGAAVPPRVSSARRQVKAKKRRRA